MTRAQLISFLVCFSVASAAEVRLAWDDNSGNEELFSLERDAGTGFAPLISVAPNVTAYTDSTVAEGATYTYRLRASNSAGDSAWSNTLPVTVGATPPPPPPPPPSASILFSSAASTVETDNDNSASLTFAQNALTDGYVVVGVSMYDPDPGASITSASYGGTGMTLLGTVEGASAYTEVYLFGLAVGNKPAGSYAVALTASTGIDQLVFGVAAYSNVHQTGSVGPFTAITGWDTTPSVNVSTAAGDMVVDILGHDSGSTSLGASQTQSWKQEDATDNTDGVSSRASATGTTTTMSYVKSVSAPWSLGAIALKAAAAGEPPPPPPPPPPPTLIAYDVHTFTVVPIVTKGGTSGRATILVKKQDGKPVAGVIITIEWTGVVAGYGMGSTNTNGKLVLNSPKTKQSGVATVTVTQVASPSGYAYDPAMYGPGDNLVRTVTLNQ